MLEHIYDKRAEKHAVRQFALTLLDHGYFIEKIPQRERPYIVAELKLVASDPEHFVKSGYSFSDMRFRSFVNSKSGKLKSCEAYWEESFLKIIDNIPQR